MKYFYQFLVIIFILSSCSPKVTTGWDYGGFAKFDYGGYEKTMNKFCKEYGFRLVEGGTFSIKNSKEIILNSDQNNVLYNPESYRYTKSSFYMSDHEVTNKEYRKFVTWVKNNQSQNFIYHGEKKYFVPGTLDSTHIENKQAQPINILPDTSVWLKSSCYVPQDTIHRFYFSHPYFDNYPVVGVSKNQAQAYCYWVTQRYNKECHEKWPAEDNRILLPSLRLATEHEYRLALHHLNYSIKKNKMSFDPTAITNEDKQSVKFINGRGGTVTVLNAEKMQNKKGKFIANFGKIKDQNNIVIKGFTENDFKDKYTTPVKSFDPTVICRDAKGSYDYGIYDLLGNVDEWVLDVWIQETIEGEFVHEDGTIEYVKRVNPYLNDYFTENESNNFRRWKNVSYEQIIPYKLTINDDDEIATKKYIYLRDSLWASSHWNENIELKASRDLHNLKALHILKDPCMSIGGSWADNQAILLNHMVKVYEKNESSATVGFRCVFDRATHFSPGKYK